MNKFIILTFGFLGLSFYELSGGADYQPMVRADATPATQEVTSEPVAVSTRSAPETNAARIILASAEAKPDVPSVTTPSQAAFSATKADAVTADVSREQMIKDSLAESKPALLGQVDAPQVEAMAFTSSDTATSPAIDPARDVRAITGDRVNLRAGPGTGFDIASKLSKGARVEVLDEPGNGWVYLRTLDTNQTEGWMADFLLAAVN